MISRVKIILALAVAGDFRDPSSDMTFEISDFFMGLQTKKIPSGSDAPGNQRLAARVKGYMPYGRLVGTAA